MNRRIALIAVTVAIILLTAGFVAHREIATRRNSEWVEIKRDDLPIAVEVTGELESTESATFEPPSIPNFWNYKISMMAPEGLDVKAGAPVLAFDSSELDRELEQKRAERDSARKAIDQKQANLSLEKEDEELKIGESDARLRKSTLKLDAPPELVGRLERREVELDNASASKESKYRRDKLSSLRRSAAEEILLLKGRYENAARRVIEIETNIGRLTLRAPRNGSVVYVMNWRSEKKKVGDSAWMGERIMEIPDLARIRARGEVDESDAGTIAANQRVRLRLDSHPDEEFLGRVAHIGRSVQLQQQATMPGPMQQVSRNPVKVLKVRIDLDRIDSSKMRPGMRFQGAVETGRIAGVVAIPAEAIFLEEGKLFAYKRSMLSSVRVPLQIGRRNREFVEVTAGLRAGDRVLIRKEDGEKAE
ncbi:MAG TPA: efflux RND transporter periplasmic adaptor subunit [Thermoanaerobaculia bacterium]|nr:efflux RND transporter periplasmic adaptor subunit [Thermoanaerobaculia bacterium]